MYTIGITVSDGDSGHLLNVSSQCCLGGIHMKSCDRN